MVKPSVAHQGFGGHARAFAVLSSALFRDLRSLTTGSWRKEEREKQLIYEIEPGREVRPNEKSFSRQECVQRELHERGSERSAGREAAREGSDRANSAKRIRAHDGCLGIGRRRRTRKTATSFGEPSTGFDPEVSEWGNPAGVKSRHRRMNQIVRWSHTRGSETSQYPQEKRSTDIA